MSQLERVYRQDDDGNWGWFTDPEASGGGSLTPPVTLTGTDPAEAVLTIEADDAQTEHIFRVYDKDGNLSVDIDADGRLDVKRFVVQVPPDTGGGPGTSSSFVAPDAWIIQSGTDTSEEPFTVKRFDADLGQFNRVVYVGRAGSIIRTNPLSATSHETALEMTASVDTAGNAIELWDSDFNNLLFAVDYKGGVTFASSDPHIAGAWWDNAGTLTRSAG